MSYCGPARVHILLFLPILVALSAYPSLPATAEDPAAPVTLEGYITATHTPDWFEINSGQRIEPWSMSAFSRVDDSGIKTGSAGIYDLHVGMYVKIDGHATGGKFLADAILIYGQVAKEIKGLGLILRVDAAGPEPVLEADGYRIHLAATTALRYNGSLKSLADVGPNTWVKYVCVRDKAGDLVALTALFSSAKTGARSAHEIARDRSHADTVPPRAILIDADGNFAGPHQKVRMGSTNGPCGWHKLVLDMTLQARVERVGLSVIPAFQKQLPPSSVTRVHFRFFAIEDSRFDPRAELPCNGGLILVPQTVAERLTSDAQLAAVLADGVAWFLQWQSSPLPFEHREVVGAEYAAALSPSPAAAAASLGSMLAMQEFVQRPIDIKMREQRDRVALNLLSEAGYDPSAAPAAWRLLAPRELPQDTSQLKYPSRSIYELTILHLEYKKEAAQAAAEAAFTDGASPAQN